jgi:hypothetical protein
MNQNVPFDTLNAKKKCSVYGSALIDLGEQK